MKKHTAKLLSILLCVALAVTMMPAAAFAATSNELYADIIIASEFTDYMTSGPAVKVIGSNFTDDTTDLWCSSGAYAISATNPRNPCV